MADAKDETLFGEVEPPRLEEKKGTSAAASSSGETKDLKSSILGILQGDSTGIDVGKTKIDEIAAQRKKLQAERKKLTGELRNETRKRQRIRKRSQYLTDEDLVEVLAMRKTKQVSAKAKAKAASHGGTA